jgi:hypothetical protein
MRHPLLQASAEIIALAKADVGYSEDERNGHYIDHFKVGPARKMLFKPKRFPAALRATVEIENDYWTAAAMEFGSGEPSVGLSSGDERQQGGWNTPKRPLGRAASKVGDWHE